MKVDMLFFALLTRLNPWAQPEPRLPTPPYANELSGFKFFSVTEDNGGNCGNVSFSFPHTFLHLILLPSTRKLLASQRLA